MQKGGGLMVMKIFYTRHIFARQLDMLSEGEYKLLGTVRLNSVDNVNQNAFEEGIVLLKPAERGSWLLVQVS